ncbi:hypothetical protein TNCV_2051351 [Trichonephila clavipes]|nr:hypothetical protein TNCV_2051351 [Trichonephila clavipes]
MWCKGNVGFKEGDLLLVKPSENSDSLKCHLARILKLHSGAAETSRTITARVIERDVSAPLHIFLEEPRGFRTRQHGRQ